MKDDKQVLSMVQKAVKLGYDLIGLTFPQETSEDKIKGLRRMCKEIGIDMASRVDLKPRTPAELTSSLRKQRRRFEILAVMCESKNVARQAAKDHRVDLLSFPALDFHKRFFDAAEAELASASLASFEIDAKPLLVQEGPVRSRLLSNLRRESAIAQGFRVPIVLSSGVSDQLLMRKPMELAALASLFDLSKASMLDAVSKDPVAIVKRNREKLDSGFIVPGVRVVRRGKDC
jgi:RNase P/RNase MRP subunit p30